MDALDLVAAVLQIILLLFWFAHARDAERKRKLREDFDWKPPHE